VWPATGRDRPQAPLGIVAPVRRLYSALGLESKTRRVAPASHPGMHKTRQPCEYSTPNDEKKETDAERCDLSSCTTAPPWRTRTSSLGGMRLASIWAKTNATNGTIYYHRDLPLVAGFVPLARSSAPLVRWLPGGKGKDVADALIPTLFRPPLSR
jgi:hypothetical protein